MGKAAAVIHSARGRTFDPADIPRAVRDAGFSSPEVEFTARGAVEKQEGWFVLRIPGVRHVFYLEGGAHIGDLKSATALLGKTIQVTGKLHGSHGERPPGMTVEEYAPVAASP